MPRLTWDASDARLFETGVDRGVLYINNTVAVPWNGLTSVVEQPTGGEAQPVYIDGDKFCNTAGFEEFEATISAYTYPDEFMEFDGYDQVRGGLFVSRQKRKKFGFSYRTLVGNSSGEIPDYKIHLVYDALASPTERNNQTVGDSVSAIDFSWKITTLPRYTPGYRRTAHIVVDSRLTDPTVLALLEDTIYGTDAVSAKLPTFQQLLTIFDTVNGLVITDNGDGTWTAEAPFDVIQMLDSTTFQITANTAIFIDDDSYNISSTPTP